MPEVSDDLLLSWQRELAKGDETAFNRIFRELYLPLVHFAVDLVKQRQAAEEIVGDVFVRLWKKREEVLLIEKLRVFLFVAVKNQCYNHLRDHSFWTVSLEADNLATLTSAYDPEEDLAFRELKHRLHLAIECLPDQCRQVFRMVREDGLKFKEVAEILQISPRTVETQLYRAIKKIRAVLSPDEQHSRQNLPGNLQSVVLLSWTLQYFFQRL
ncbi:RNA polymerase sigma-70 factor [Flavihumibacter petaseus]|uniref:Putative RNA polymerase ECF-type sigma factor n=1 Tax=Flavihumibacter petaseus NBRC 106054 TaxID=1220578 RepID=A0A0E9N5L9_9BACT|nr:RNA polymerase sigma-70 factor [Flavihumibacter petaseus]GAO44640.1 putative RNA polymerase ECF-type sigma factor [Flavihumibacter petaseus NBRC 106054]